MNSIRVIVTSTTAGRKTAIVPDTQTIREALENAEVNYAASVTYLDGVALPAGGLDKTFADYGITEKCTLTNAVKADNAADVKLVGSVAVITSVATYDELQKLAKMAPEALTVVDEDDDPVFVVGTAKTAAGCFDNNAAFFGTAKSVDGKATITVNMPEGQGKEWFADKYAGALKNLKIIENGLAEAVERVNSEFNEILESIQVA